MTIENHVLDSRCADNCHLIRMNPFESPGGSEREHTCIDG